VKSGFECGIGLERFNDIKTGDIIEVFIVERWRPPPPPKHVVALLSVEFHLPGARSLKDKRMCSGG